MTFLVFSGITVAQLQWGPAAGSVVTKHQLYDRAVYTERPPTARPRYVPPAGTSAARHLSSNNRGIPIRQVAQEISERRAVSMAVDPGVPPPYPSRVTTSQAPPGGALVLVVLFWAGLAVFAAKIRSTPSYKPPPPSATPSKSRWDQFGDGGPELVVADVDLKEDTVTGYRAGTVQVRKARRHELPRVAGIMQQNLFAFQTEGQRETSPEDVPTGLQTMWEVKLKAVNKSRGLNRRIRSKRTNLKRGEVTFEDIQQLNDARQELARLQMARMSAILIAEATPIRDGDEEDPNVPKEVIGCGTIFLNTLKTTLPPPYSTYGNTHFYISNVAVLSSARRQGVATMLLHACEVLCQRWGHPYATLHVDPGNEGALRLYQNSGYQIFEEPGRLENDTKQLLLIKPIPPMAGRQPNLPFQVQSMYNPANISQQYPGSPQLTLSETIKSMAPPTISQMPGAKRASWLSDPAPTLSDTGETQRAEWLSPPAPEPTNLTQTTLSNTQGAKRAEWLDQIDVQDPGSEDET